MYIDDFIIDAFADQFEKLLPYIKKGLLYGSFIPIYRKGYKNIKSKYEPIYNNWLNDDNYNPHHLTKHCWISGVQGSGKSNKLRRIFINSFIKKGYGGIYIDTHGTADILLHSIPPYRWKDVIYIAPWMGRVFGVNVIRRYTNLPGEIDRIAEDVVEVFRKMYPRSWGDKLANTIRFSTKAVLIAEENSKGKLNNLTLYDVYKCVTDEKYLENILSYVDNEIILSFFGNYKNNTAASKLESPLSSEDILLFLCQSNGLDILKCMEERKIIICNLDKNYLSENANLIASLLISVITQCAAKRKENNYHPYFAVALDEFYEYATKYINVLIEQMRKKNVCLLLANQNRDQMPKYIQSAVAMCQTKFIHTIAPEDIGWVKGLYKKWFTDDQLVSLPFYHYISDIHNDKSIRNPVIKKASEFIKEYDYNYVNKLKYASLSFAPSRYDLKKNMQESIKNKLTVLNSKKQQIIMTGEFIDIDMEGIL